MSLECPPPLEARGRRPSLNFLKIHTKSTIAPRKTTRRDRVHTAHHRHGFHNKRAPSRPVSLSEPCQSQLRAAVPVPGLLSVN